MVGQDAFREICPDFVIGVVQTRATLRTMSATELPTPWQRKTLWNAVTAFAVVAIGAIAVGLIWLASECSAFFSRS
jgi:hypothetical protein